LQTEKLKLNLMKKYVITGSVGHISKPVIKNLVTAGKEVSVVTSNPEKVKEIESLGAKALVGSVFDASFLKSAFLGAEVVYAMIPPIWQTDNWRASQREVAKNYTEAIKSNGIKYVVDLSSAGAHRSEGCGPVSGIYEFEQMLNNIDGLNVIHVRPSYFYYNFFNMIGMIKQAGIMGGNFGGGDFQIALIHTDDIARVITDELLSLNFKGSSARHIYGDTCTTDTLAKVLGDAIGKQVPWVAFTDDQQLQGMLGAGLSRTHAEGYTEMGTALRNGIMQEELLKVEPLPNAIKLQDFAKEFKAAFLA
jgi:uncharacterized protein YbjT (DUF2867 family)